MKIGYRTLKTALAAPIAVFIAQLLQLEHYGSAGIIAVLCIQPTRKQSFLTAWHRIAAGLLSIVFAYFIFEFIGYSPFTIALLLILFIPITNLLKIAPGIVTSLVILFHFYGDRMVSWELIINEVAIMLIGIGSALIFNLYMPSLDAKLTKIKSEIERLYQASFRNFAAYLRGEESTLPYQMVNAISEHLEEANQLVRRNIENTFSRNAQRQQAYFSMRGVQLETLNRMVDMIKPLEVSLDQSRRIASLFEDLADAIYPDNAAQYYIDQIAQLRETFEHDPLPLTRQEFEIRARLFHILFEIEHYLIIKNQTVTEF
ncbi:aromatic acid exporter family protein [Amphibacillus sediminis]|uniref:aromatic acid exporter family protein n=1 Tax=Amphibacillus sediminis TaxID=360185 RepID=UPI00082BBF41|nr:aromatic acid exporter family protein [Amphibacillus sediminis]